MLLFNKIINIVTMGLMVVLIFNSNNVLAISSDSGYYPTVSDTTGWVWSNIGTVSTENNLSSFYPSADVDGNNNVHVVWFDYSTPIDQDIFYKKYDYLTSSWGDTVLISVESNVNSYLPRIKVDSQNNIYVVWQDFNTGTLTSDLLLRKYDYSTSSWGNTVVISTESTTNSADPSIDIDSNDNLHITWTDNTDIYGAGTDPDIFYKKYDSLTDSLSNLTIVSSGNTGISRNPELIVDSQNNVYVVWEDSTSIYGGVDSDILFRKFNALTSYWESIELISILSTCISTNPKLSIDSFDFVHLVWADCTDISLNGNDFDVFYTKYFPSISTWSSLRILSAESDTDVKDLSISVDLFDNVYVVWCDDKVVAQTSLAYKKYNFDTASWSPRQYLSQDTGSNPQTTEIISDNVGFVYAFWSQVYDTTNTGTDYDIHYRTLSGMPDSPVIQLTSPNPTNNYVGISWDQVMGASSYNIYRDVVPILTLDGMTPYDTTADEYFVDSLDNGGIYYYAVTGVNTIGEGAMSNVIYTEVEIPVDPITIIIEDNQTITQDNFQTLTEFTDAQASFPMVWLISLFATIVVLRKKYKHS
ncbi:MAG: hypothetical protein OEY49_13755 [Candidatus Heimdallarchaeota archaeon]|nr:hypothetical protein [Candidatus Heimdallarchaeota archaeon]